MTNLLDRICEAVGLLRPVLVNAHLHSLTLNWLDFQDAFDEVGSLSRENGLILEAAPRAGKHRLGRGEFRLDVRFRG